MTTEMRLTLLACSNRWQHIQLRVSAYDEASKLLMACAELVGWYQIATNGLIQYCVFLNESTAVSSHPHGFQMLDFVSLQVFPVKAFHGEQSSFIFEDHLGNENVVPFTPMHVSLDVSVALLQLNAQQSLPLKFLPVRPSKMRVFKLLLTIV